MMINILPILKGIKERCKKTKLCCDCPFKYDNDDPERVYCLLEGSPNMWKTDKTELKRLFYKIDKKETEV